MPVSKRTVRGTTLCLVIISITTKYNSNYLQLNALTVILLFVLLAQIKLCLYISVFYLIKATGILWLLNLRSFGGYVYCLKYWVDGLAGDAVHSQLITALHSVMYVTVDQ